MVAADIGTRIGTAIGGLDLPWIAPYGLVVGVAISISGITFLNMLFRRTAAQKRIASIITEGFAVAVSRAMRWPGWPGRSPWI